MIFLCERWIPCQALTSVLCLHYHPETVHCITKDVHTSEITFFALHPWFILGISCKFISLLKGVTGNVWKLNWDSSIIEKFSRIHLRSIKRFYGKYLFSKSENWLFKILIDCLFWRLRIGVIKIIQKRLRKM